MIKYPPEAAPERKGLLWLTVGGYFSPLWLGTLARKLSQWQKEHMAVARHMLADQKAEREAGSRGSNPSKDESTPRDLLLPARSQLLALPYPH